MSHKSMITQTSDDFVPAFGRYPALRCTACSKRSKQRCNGFAVRGHTVCRMHGAGGGPKTPKGIEQIASAHLAHGRETRANRRIRQANRAKLLYLIELGRTIGLFIK